MISHRNLTFPSWARQLRLDHGLRQREVAIQLGLKPKSYSNCESAPHKTISRDRAIKLGRLYKLAGEELDAFVAAWDAMPLSAYAQKQQAMNGGRTRDRSKVRGFDRLRDALIDVTALLVTSVSDPGSLCACEPPALGADEESPPCELCNALVQLGIGRWTTLPEVIDGLAQLQEAQDNSSP